MSPRRNIFLLILLSFCLPACQSGISPEEVLPPNIIWLVAEDQSPQFFPMYGDSTIALPNLSQLAQDGVVFNNAYSPVPVCAPARSAIITGLYPTTLGTHNMRTYKKWSEENEPSIEIPNYSPLVPQGVKMFTEYLRKEGYYCTNNAKEDYNFRVLPSAWDDSSDKAHWRNPTDSKPFFSVFNFGVCHESGIWRNGDKELFAEIDAIKVPPYFPDTPVVRHDMAVNYSNLKRLDEQIGEVLQQLKEDGLYENSIIFFYADHGGPFPRHKRALYETGIKVPLIVKFQGNKRGSEEDSRMISFIDFAPTVLSLAGIEPPKVMQGIAHFGEYKKDKGHQYIFATSDRFDEQTDRLRAVKSEGFKYIRSYKPELPHALPVSYREQMPMMRELNTLFREGALNADAAAWLNAPKPEEELYDLKKDPYELTNLVRLADYQDTLIHLRGVLNNWIDLTNDLGKYPEKELLAKWFLEGPPKLPSTEMLEKDGLIRLTNAVHDATLIWKQEKDSAWTIFKDPIPVGQSFMAKAVRIGYEDSELLLYEGL